MRRLVAMIAILLGTVLGAQSATPAEELAATEREFSKESVENGMFKAFVKFFADDGIHFSPLPSYTRFDFAPEAAKPKPEFQLAWYPTITKVSNGGDLGFQIGPWTITDLSEKKRPPRNGYFFSIWRKTPEGWRVVVDSGIRTPGSVADPPESWKASTPAYKTKSAGNSVTSDTLFEVDRNLGFSIQKDGIAAALQASLTNSFVVLREQQYPLRSQQELAPVLKQAAESGSWSMLPLRCEVGTAGDAGYCLGTFTTLPKAADAQPVQGFYIHVWERDEKGNWKLAIDQMRNLDRQ